MNTQSTITHTCICKVAEVAQRLPKLQRCNYYEISIFSCSASHAFLGWAAHYRLFKTTNFSVLGSQNRHEIELYVLTFFKNKQHFISRIWPISSSLVTTALCVFIQVLSSCRIRAGSSLYIINKHLLTGSEVNEKYRVVCAVLVQILSSHLQHD